jgi:hypothetical protein
MSPSQVSCRLARLAARRTLTHDRDTAQAIAARREARQLWRSLRQMLAQLKNGGAS